MHFTLPTLVPLATTAAYLTIGAVVASGAPKSRVRSALARYVSLMGLWSFCSFMAHLDSPLLSPLTWVRLSIIPTSLAPWAVLGYTFAFLGRRTPRWATLYLPLGLVSGSLSFMGLGIQEVVNTSGRLETTVHPVGWAMAVLAVTGYGLALATLLRAYRNSRDVEFRNRTLYPAVGILLVAAGIFTNLTPLGDYASDIAASLLNAILLAYAIQRHRVVNIRSVLLKALAVLLAIGALGGAYTAAVLAVEVTGGVALGLVPLATVFVGALFVAVLFEPLVRRIQQALSALASEPLDTSPQRLLEVGLELNRSLDPTALEGALQSALARVCGASFGRVLVQDPRGERYTPLSETGEGNGVASQVSLQRDSPLLTLLQQAGGPVTAEEVLEHPLARGLVGPERTLLGGLTGGGVLVPLLSHAEVTGVLLVGQKRSGLTYSDAERRLIGILANHAASAVQNARLYRDLLKANQALVRTQQAMRHTQKMQAIAEVAAGVAHDFSNLLTPIVGRAELALARTQDPDLRRTLEVIVRAATDAGRLSRRLLLFARQQTSRVRTPVALPQVVAETLEFVRPRLKEAEEVGHARIAVVEAVQATRAVLGDPAELREVLVNLVLNAIDAMPAGGTLTIAACDGPTPTGCA